MMTVDPDTKDSLKEALKEWLDERVKDLGWWSLHTLTVLALGALTYFILQMNGWSK